MEPLLVITNVPAKDIAVSLARELIERRLAACVNILPSVHSVYRWEGKMEEASEVMLLIKSFKKHYATLEKIICELHPYDLPEVIAVPISQGLPAYLAWMAQET